MFALWTASCFGENEGAPVAINFISNTMYVLSQPKDYARDTRENRHLLRLVYDI